MRPHTLLRAIVVLLATCGSTVVGQQTVTVQLEYQGRRLEGTPLTWSASNVFLLSRDGYLFDFHPDQAKNYRQTATSFSSFNQAEMKGMLRQEFGRAFDVSSTGHYLVVHPAGEKDQWALRFEELYRSFLQYFTTRGFKPEKPLFPLVAVVLPNQQQFDAYGERTNTKLAAGTLGFYSPVSNRIALYDITGGQENHPQWDQNLETIIHEAAHQMAFNTGIHSRYASPPRWLAEGLGTLFETKGAWNSSKFPRQSDRINQGRFRDFTSQMDRRPKGSLVSFVSNDHSFQSNPQAAYAEAWALSFFLIETRANKYREYLALTAKRSNFSEYPSPRKLADFVQVFGDPQVLEQQFLQFMRRLK